ncbi:MAG: rhodanese-like domain-containing protein [Chloroflexota bacterium]
MSSTKGKTTMGKGTTPAAASAQRTTAGATGTGTKAKKGASAVDARRRQNRIIGVVAVAAIAVLAVGIGWTFLSRPSGSVAAGTGGAAMASSQGTVEQGNGGQWTTVSADTLAAMLAKKDFTFLDVKTPYIGEIDGTDLYIPYTDLTARASALPADKAAPIVVYCRAGNESRVAAQALLDLGYTNIINLDGGMAEWTASGRRIVDKNRG